MNPVFPTWRYHKSQNPRLVHTAEELEAMGLEWADSPAAFETKESEEESAPKETQEQESEPAPEAKEADETPKPEEKQEQEAAAKPEPTEAPAETYHEHMAKWESKSEKKSPGRKRKGT